jgi:DNA repair photolyase
MNEEVKQIVGDAPEAEVDGVAEEGVKQPAEQKKRGTNQKKAKEPARKRVKVEEEKKAEKA